MSIVELVKKSGLWDTIGNPKELEVFASLVRAEALAESVKREPVGFVTQKLMPGFGWRKDVVFVQQVEVGADLYVAPVSAKMQADCTLAAVLAEREACAKVCDERELANLYGFKECAAAIRARG